LAADPFAATQGAQFWDTALQFWIHPHDPRFCGGNWA